MAQEDQAPKSRIGRRIAAALAGLFVLGLVALGGAAYWAKSEFEAPGPSDQEIVLQFERGLGLAAIATRLHEAGAITHPLLFRLGAHVYRADRALKAGEYAIPARASMAAILGLLREGKSILHKLTVPEGLTSYEVMQLVEAHPVLIGEMPPLPPEGALLPETYLFERGTTRTDLVERMHLAMSETLAELWATRADDLPVATPHEAVILASIVEKETGIAEERPRVAAVFVNRLKRPMRLQSDPTIIYGITGGKGPLGRPIRQSELERATPYNTYQIDGLPPTPISNPGRETLAAVLNPPETNELYFVADGTGGHVFARTLNEHLRNVAKWRRIERERGSR